MEEILWDGIDSVVQKQFIKHAFTIWLLIAVLLAMFFPEPGSKGGLFYSEFTTKLGVWIIFFLQGLSLPTSELASGFRPLRLHGFVLGWNFLFFPLITGLILLVAGIFLTPELQLGFWLLAILPTTISSAVTFSAVSGGNTPNAIFSTVFSNLLAVLLVPAIAVSYLSAGEGVSIPLAQLFIKLSLLIILPLIVGQVIRRFAHDRAQAFSKKTKWLANGIIIFIVHCAFAKSVSSGFLKELAAGSVIAVIVCAVLLLLLVSYLVWKTSIWIKPNRPQRITAFYCASQKSLVTGLPLATSILAAAPQVVDAAPVLIPLMCFHPAQIVLAGVVSGHLAGDRR